MSDAPLPPHDVAAEEAVIAALLLDEDVPARVRPLLSAADFFREQNAWIYEVCLALADRGESITLPTVCHELNRRGQLDDAGGEPYLVEVGGRYFTAVGVEAHARLIAEAAGRRRAVEAAQRVVRGAYAERDLGGLLSEIESAADGLRQLVLSTTGHTSTWDPTDLEALLAGELVVPAPSLLQRTDGVALLYEGRVNTLYGESGAGKSMIAAVGEREALLAGRCAMRLDFESDATSVASIHLEMGVPSDVLAARYIYVRPDDPLSPADRGRLLALVADRRPAVVTVDGWNEALTLHGLDPNSTPDNATLARQLLRPIADLGPAVVFIDHVGRNAESRGGFAIGSQHKRSLVSGVALELSAAVPFGRGRTGLVRLTVRKDRPGYLDGIAATGRRIAEIDLASDPTTGAISATVRPPEVSEGPAGTFRPTVLMARVAEQLSTELRLGVRDIEQRVRGRKDAIRQAIDVLVDEGYVERTTGSRGKLEHRLVRPFDDGARPSPDRPPLSPGDGDRDCPPSPAPMGGGDVGDGHSEDGTFERPPVAVGATVERWGL